MSGIFGMVLLDGGQPRPADIQAMARELERRGPDGTHMWTEGNVAIGHTLLATTPEALVEILPLTDPDTGCTITADCRLDNREELIGELGLGEIDRVIGDGELIMRAYLRWGEDCPARLLGDFAFAIWDPRQEKLFCARDHMGMRQLIYHHRPEKLFVFATEANAVIVHDGVPHTLNEGRVADFLDNLEGVDLTSTFFSHVVRLPPAHCLIVRNNDLNSRCYWDLQAESELKLESDEAYAEAFLDVFTEAVRCRLRSAGPVGSMLSGGMDSGSVVAVAAKLLATEGRDPIRTFSAVGPDPSACIETRTVRLTAAIAGVSPNFINYANMENYLERLKWLPESGEPFDYHMTLIRAVYLGAHDHGIKVMLDGVVGDVALNAGNRAIQLLRERKIVAAIAEGRAEAQFWGSRWPFWKAFPQAIWGAWIPSVIRHQRRLIRAWLSDRQIGRVGAVSRQLAASVDLAARRARYRRHSAGDLISDRQKRVRSILHPHIVAARERYDRVASAWGIEPRDPFLDVRVVQFCLSLPPDQLQAGGWPKLILRRAMCGLLPEAVIWRRGKEHLGWAFTLALFGAWATWSDELQSEISVLERFLATTHRPGGNHTRGKGLDTEERIKLFFLLRWLRRSGFGRPVTARMSGIEHAKADA